MHFLDTLYDVVHLFNLIWEKRSLKTVNTTLVWINLKLQKSDLANYGHQDMHFRDYPKVSIAFSGSWE